jgi:eukaryotic-like serine/threonine-protein kinase
VPDLIDGRYELLEVIASGGMATVWRAFDTRLDREVAVKRPHPGPPDDPQRERILREARAAASIGHPNLVTVFDVGEDRDGLFMVMELVDGPTLGEIGDGLVRSEIVEIGAEMAEALAIVHGVGVVHRDVKPSNILMSERGPLLTDFGLALSEDQSRITQHGQVMATPSYAAPEVIEGAPPTAKSDVFSLAVTLYELLAGRAPFSQVDRTTPPAKLDDPTLDEILRSALATVAEMRPDAATFASRLRDSAPTQPMMQSEGSTIPITTIAPSEGQVEIEEVQPKNRSLLGPGLLLALLLILSALALATRDDGAVLAAETTTPTSVTTSTSTSTTLANTTSTATVTAGPTVESIRAELESTLLAIHPSELKPKDQRSIMSDIDEAIVAAGDADIEKAAEKLDAAAKEIDRKLEGESRADALDDLEILASLLGVEEEEGEGESDD